MEKQNLDLCTALLVFVLLCVMRVSAGGSLDNLPLPELTGRGIEAPWTPWSPRSFSPQNFGGTTCAGHRDNVKVGSGSRYAQTTSPELPGGIQTGGCQPPRTQVLAAHLWGDAPTELGMECPWLGGAV